VPTATKLIIKKDKVKEGVGLLVNGVWQRIDNQPLLKTESKKLNTLR
jgi:hypothetical protein